MPLEAAVHAVFDDLVPHQIAVSAYDGVSAAVLERLVGKERRMNAAVHDPRAALARDPADFVAAQRVARVDANADHIPCLDRGFVDRIEGFVDHNGDAPTIGCRTSQDVQPAGRDDCHTERDVAGVDQMHLHSASELSFAHLGRAVSSESTELSGGAQTISGFRPHRHS